MAIAGVVGLTQYSYTNKWLRWVLIWIFGVYIIFVVEYNTWDSVGDLIPALMVYAIWISFAVPPLLELQWGKIIISILLVIILGLSLLLRIPGSISRIDPRDQDQAA